MLARRPATLFVGQPVVIRPGRFVGSGSTASQSCSGAARRRGTMDGRGHRAFTEVRR